MLVQVEKIKREEIAKIEQNTLRASLHLDFHI